MSNPNDRQVGGSHYKISTLGGGEEHWDRVQRLGLDYFQAQITKYTERAWKKNGLEDLKKAQHFLEKYISLKEEESKPAWNPEYAPLASFPTGRVKPTGWLGYTFEGADADGFLYTCQGCNAKLRTSEHEDPQGRHRCPIELR